MDKNQEILRRLSKEYKDEGTALHFQNPFQLLVATILAAQCTDARVNIVTKDLFERFKTPYDLADASIEEVEDSIKTCGLYKNKAKNLVACAKRLCAAYGGEVPNTMEDLTTLAGVGRKTANVVLAFAFGIPAFPVDTHVKRVCNRIGFAHSQNPDQVEKQATQIIKKEDWTQAHHWLIWHGRRVCKAQKPLCAKCCIADLCPQAAHDSR